jgi:hypothetical protein
VTTTEAPTAPARRSLGWLSATAALATYAVGAVALYSRLPLVPSAQMPVTPLSDNAQQVWFLAWPAHALAHGQNPFVSNYMNFPDGLNMMANTSMLLLGVLFAPLTWIAGPIATYVTLLRLGFFASSASACLAARRLGASWWAAFVAGAVFGFGAQRMADGLQHVFLAVDVVLPWVVVCAVRLYERRYGWLRFSLATAALISVDFLISAERAAMEVIIVVAAIVIDLAVSRESSRAKDLAAALGATLAGTAVLLCVPLWYFFFGPQAVHGQPHRFLGWPTSWHAIFQPGGYAWWAPFGHDVSSASALLGAWFNPSFIGVGLVAAAALGIYRHRREGFTWCAVGVAAAFWLTSFGPRIFLGISVPGPYSVIASLPLVRDALPSRYMEVVVLAVAWFAGRSLDAGRDEAPSSSQVLRIAAAVAVVAGLLGLVPGQRVAPADAGVPAWLSTGVAAQALPDGASVMTYPYAIVLLNQPILDQSQSGRWYRLVGGQAIVPGGVDDVTHGVEPLAPTLVFDALYRSALADPNAPVALPFPVGPLPPLSAETFASFRRFASDNKITYVFWRQWGYHPELALHYLEGSFGSPTSYDAGRVMVWHVGAESASAPPG